MYKFFCNFAPKLVTYYKPDIFLSMKRLYLFVFAFIFSICSFAFDKQALADTISRYVNEQANVGKINITKVFARNNSITLQASKNLEWVPLNEKQVAHIRLLCSLYVNNNANSVVAIYTNGYELGELISPRNLRTNANSTAKQKRFTLTAPLQPLTKNISLPYNIEQGLQDIHLAVYGSHGLYYNQQEQRWIFQRAKLLTTIEDLYTSSYTMPFLVPMLENAGAIVIQPRERDTQDKEIIVDDRQLILPQGWQQTTTGGWSMPLRPLSEGENPFTMGGYAFTDDDINKNSDKQLVYSPKIEQEDEYAVYVSYKTLENSTNSAEYIVMHSGVRTIFHVNQQMGGSTWVYLGTFHFSTDPKLNFITVSNRGRLGSVLTSDAIRLGGGVGSVGRYPYTEDTPDYQETSGCPRYIEGARYYMQYSGIPDSVYNFSKGQNDYTDDFASRGRWINYISGGSQTNPSAKGLNIPIHAALAFHTDAGLKKNDSIVGTLVIYTDKNNNKSKTYPTGISRLSARQYADYIQTQLVEDIRATYAPEWQRRELKNASYSETRNPEVPTIILELLAHQNLADMRYGHDPRFKFLVCRAVYKGILKYLHEQYSTPYTVQPLPINNFKIDFADESGVTLTWQATNDSLEPTAKPDFYVVYRRENNGDWDNGTRTKKTTITLPLNKNTQYDFRVAAGNKGGISLPSETLSAFISSQSQGKILIINGFHRLAAPESFRIDSTYAGFTPFSHGVQYGKDIAYIGAQKEFRLNEPWVSDDAGGFGDSYMDYAYTYTMGNTFDYPVMHGKVLAELGYSYVSSSADAIDSISSDFNAIDIIMGKQRTTILGTDKTCVDFKTFDNNLQLAISDYLMRGGNMLLSGAYIASDLNTEEQDKDFMQRCLHANFAAQNASKNGRIKITRLIQPTTLHLYTEPNKHVIHAESTEALKPFGDSAIVFARYADSNTNAAIAWDANNRTIFYAFPLESIDEFEQIYKKSINWLLKK